MSVEAGLDRLIAALRGGGIEDLGGLAEALEAELARIGPLDGAAAQRIRDRAQEAALLLEAAAKGVRAARRRIAEIRATGQDGAGLSTYGPGGQRAPLQAPGVIQRF